MIRNNRNLRFTFWKRTIKRLTRLGLQCQTPLRSYPLSLIPCSLSPSTVPFTKFRWGLLSFLWLWLLWFWLLWLSPAKVKSTPNPRPKTGVWQKFVYFSLMECYSRFSGWVQKLTENLVLVLLWMTERTQSFIDLDATCLPSRDTILAYQSISNFREAMIVWTSGLE